MDSFQKYSRLMILLAGCFFGFIVFIALLIFVLRLFSITIFHIPGFDLLFQYIIICIPYLLFFGAYYYLYKKTGLSRSRASRLVAILLLSAGCLFGLFALGLATASFLHFKSALLKIFDENSQYALITQLFIIFITAGVIASGDAREKDWMDKKSY